MNDIVNGLKKEDGNIIELVVPFKAEFVSIVRLTASGVANRIGFDIETIEDIKVAIAEVCNKLISTGSSSASKFSIRFSISMDEMDITFDCEDRSLKCIFGDEQDDLGISIINALMDKVVFCSDDSHILSMSKTLERDN